ncbi:Protein MtfA [Candidatus Brocadiaceae bacterium S225]|uniref:Protein MtfA n=1 Tax=Candidatus Scalindua brodae TaxID=237368 RepID=A0A0B0ESE4_9BACT|nr:MAG: Protein MtfA [Candidatus Scalindua brodae]TWU29192.1 Protein MtfA [Candidatus Brocadiaceae bacterium S225]
MFGFRQRRRKRLRMAPFPADWLIIVERNVPIYRYLPEADQKELQSHILIFLDEKKFEGCGGLEINDEIKVTIAAQACILLLHRKTNYYHALKSIVVYPTAYVAHESRPVGNGIVAEGESVRLGESWHRGAVVLSWNDVLYGAADIHDGHNVVFHEFAHQIDHDGSESQGSPVMEKRSMYLAWARILGAEYARLRKDNEHGRRTVMDRYGATNPAEFFAVATECFFEKPLQLKQKHPELYEEFMLYYQQDPAEFYLSGKRIP